MLKLKQNSVPYNPYTNVNFMIDFVSIKAFDKMYAWNAFVHDHVETENNSYIHIQYRCTFLGRPLANYDSRLLYIHLILLQRIFYN